MRVKKRHGERERGMRGERQRERERERKRERERERERERAGKGKIGRASCRERVSSPV